MTLVTPFALALLGACASSPDTTPAPARAAGGSETAELICSETPKNCLPMPEEAFAGCVSEIKSRQGSGCFDKLVALKRCFVTTSECNEAGELIENEAADRACASETSELEACCEANAGDASCQF
jgi:hypothetical protein